MKYCTKCGAEIEDDAVVCVHCGCATNDQKAKSSNNNMGKTALVFMILACVLNPLASILQVLQNGWTGLMLIIGCIFSCITLAWCIPMTIYFARKLKNGESVGTGFKVCSLLFVSLIGGILMLCMPKDNQ